MATIQGMGNASKGTVFLSQEGGMGGAVHPTHHRGFAMPEEILYRVTSKYFVAGAVVKDGKIVKAAPILRIPLGTSAQWLEQYAEMKGWKIEKIKLMSSDPDHG